MLTLSSFIHCTAATSLEHNKQHQIPSHSSISEFTSLVRHTEEEVSSVSLFTIDKVPQNVLASAIVSSSIESSIAAPAVVPVKPRGPRPRPAYKGPSADLDSIEDGTNAAASTTPNAPSTAMPVTETCSDPLYSQDIAERAKMRRRHATEGNSEGKGKQKEGLVYGASRSVRRESLLAASSRRDSENMDLAVNALVSESELSDLPDLVALEHDINIRPQQADISFLPTSDLPGPSSAVQPSIHTSPVHAETSSSPTGLAPMSSFTNHKRKRRRLLSDDFISEDSAQLPMTSETGFTDNGIRRKEQQTQHFEENKESNPVPRSTKKMRRRRAKVPEQDYKSKELIEASSDDDIALKPRNPSNQKSGPSYSDPASIAFTVPPSDLSPTMQASVFIPALSSKSALPTVPYSDPPSVHASTGPTFITESPPSPTTIITPKPTSDRKRSSKNRKRRLPEATELDSNELHTVNLRDLDEDRSSRVGRGKNKNKKQAKSGTVVEAIRSSSQSEKGNEATSPVKKPSRGRRTRVIDEPSEDEAEAAPEPQKQTTIPIAPEIRDIPERQWNDNKVCSSL